MKILWTFNPFDKNAELHKFGKNLLNTLFDQKDSLEVIYVASNVEAELATAYNIPIEKRYSEYPQKLIEDKLKKLSLKKIKVKVLFEKSLSLTSTVKNIVAYSKKKKIDLILIATNSKKLLPRTILGSFAETLVHLSSCDLLIYHQKTKFNSKLPANIIYGHDFSGKGETGLKKVIEYTKKWQSTLSLVHIPVPEVGMELHEFRKMTEEKVLKIENHLKRQKISYKIYIEYDVRPISETLMDIAGKSKGNIIAVTAQANKLEAFLGGSVTRQILRESTLPTLVLKV